MKKKSAKRRSKYSSEQFEAPIGKVEKMEDFLPPPEVLFATDDKVKITIEIEGTTLDFFRTQAEKTGNKYQRLMREVLKQYAKKYSA
ncbi:hypothetical protein QJS83_15190 [Bdellovibrio sp. 22V]|uniref:hypothetical protein n=1 Tax=Bdellovibrio TaxID=958 RepID=UPI0025432DE7|nr:hypothetical protein [Bdellovibrio sp. 22V]WII71808.1 hypothetical protein QJS83_15190 [Bdellovibrio sp. 22V]